jgi:hypothetical protein
VARLRVQGYRRIRQDRELARSLFNLAAPGSVTVLGASESWTLLESSAFDRGTSDLIGTGAPIRGSMK